MKTKTLLVTIVAFAISGAAFAQIWEQKYQQADAELNRVYKELRSNLSEQQKAELKGGLINHNTFFINVFGMLLAM